MYINISCCVCGKKVSRRKAEVARSTRLGRRLYCSRSCVGKDNISNIPEPCRTTDHMDPGNQRDEYSPFRWHLRNIKRRRECTVTLKDLKEQWERQDGVCPYSGWKMVNVNSTSHRLPHSPNRASLDRKDSTKGYTKDNIQFVSLIAQYAKNEWGEKELFVFCEAVHGKSKGCTSLLLVVSVAAMCL